MTYDEVRFLVASSDAKLDLDNYCWFGIDFVDGECYRKFYLPPDIDNLARFLCSNKNNKLVCSDDDLAVLCACGNELDVVNADDYLLYKLNDLMTVYKQAEKPPKFKLLN